MSLKMLNFVGPSEGSPEERVQCQRSWFPQPLRVETVGQLLLGQGFLGAKACCILAVVTTVHADHLSCVWTFLFTREGSGEFRGVSLCDLRDRGRWGHRQEVKCLPPYWEDLLLREAGQMDVNEPFSPNCQEESRKKPINFCDLQRLQFCTALCQ